MGNGTFLFACTRGSFAAAKWIYDKYHGDVVVEGPVRFALDFLSVALTCLSVVCDIFVVVIQNGENPVYLACHAGSLSLVRWLTEELKLPLVTHSLVRLSLGRGI